MGGWVCLPIILILMFMPHLKPPSETIKTLHISDPILCEYEKTFHKNAKVIDSLPSFLFTQSSCGSSAIAKGFVLVLAGLVGITIGGLLFRQEVFTAFMLAGTAILIPLGPAFAYSVAEAIGIEVVNKRTILQKLIDDRQWEKAANFVDTLGVPVSDTQKAYIRAQVLFLESKPDQAKEFTQKVFNDINNPTLMAKPEVMYVLEKSAFGIPKSQIALSAAR